MKAFGKKQKKPSVKKSTNSNIVVGDHVAPSKTGKLRKTLNTFFQSKRNIAITGGIIVFTIIVMFSYMFMGAVRNDGQEDAVESGIIAICSDSSPVFQQSASIIATNHLSQLKPFAEEIQTKPQYKSDPNCLYIVTVYYLGVGDFDTAKEYSDKLKELDGDVSRSLTNGGGSVEDIQNRASSLGGSQSGGDNFVGVENPDGQGGGQ